MELREYKTMFESEDTHWWYRGLHELVETQVRRQIAERGSIRLLDAGCGTGGFLHKSEVDEYWGMDSSPLALEFCRTRGLPRIFQASVEAIPCAAGEFDMVISLDVLYHRQVRDDLEALKEFHRVLAPGGMLLLNLPAYDCLQSSHDKAIHTGRRYTRAILNRRLAESGFSHRRVFYRNSLLFPLALTVRALKNIFGGNKSTPVSDLESNHAILESLLLNILRAENFLVSAGFALPFGLSVFAVSVKS